MGHRPSTLLHPCSNPSLHPDMLSAFLCSHCLMISSIFFSLVTISYISPVSPSVFVFVVFLFAPPDVVCAYYFFLLLILTLKEYVSLYNINLPSFPFSVLRESVCLCIACVLVISLVLRVNWLTSQVCLCVCMKQNKICSVLTRTHTQTHTIVNSGYNWLYWVL